jgi:multiple sugar transport system permease protein
VSRAEVVSRPGVDDPLIRRKAARPATSGRRRQRESWWALAMIAPLGLGLGIFYLWPVVQTVYFSFTEWGPFGDSVWTGLANYRKLFHDPEVLQALRNTGVYTVVILLTIPLAMGIATLINQRGLKGKGLFRVLYFLPVVTMPAAVGLVWQYLYNGDSGLINTALRSVGIHGTSWMTNEHTALYALAVVGIWSQLGYGIVLFMAGLQGIPADLYDAAKIDGAGWFATYRNVTVPLLSPTTLFISIIFVINSLQLFDLVYLMVPKTSPAARSTNTIVTLFYQKSFVEGNGGYGAAIVLLLLVVIGLVTGVQFLLQRRWVHYD